MKRRKIFNNFFESCVTTWLSNHWLDFPNKKSRFQLSRTRPHITDSRAARQNQFQDEEMYLDVITIQISYVLDIYNEKKKLEYFETSTSIILTLTEEYNTTWVQFWSCNVK